VRVQRKKDEAPRIEIVHGQQLADVLHEFGVNVRYLPMIRHNISAADDQLRRIIGTRTPHAPPTHPHTHPTHSLFHTQPLSHALLSYVRCALARILTSPFIRSRRCRAGGADSEKCAEMPHSSQPWWHRAHHTRVATDGSTHLHGRQQRTAVVLSG
jgi:hypothetical protein